MNLPWDCAVADGHLFLRSKMCLGKVEVGRDASACRSCCILARNNALKGIVQRMKDGDREGSGYAYHAIDGLHQLLRIKTKQIQYCRLRHLDHTRELARRMRVLGDHKRLLEAIASGKLERVDKIVRFGLRQGRSVKHMVSQYMKAAKGLYKPKDYQEEDYRRGLVLWRL